MRFLKEGELGFNQYLLEVERRAIRDSLRFEREVRSILLDIQKRGDKALLYYIKRFDGLRISIDQLRVKRSEIQNAYQKIPQEFLKTLKRSAHRIRRFHKLTFKKWSEPMREKGILLGRVMRPLERVGIYVPGGKASYPSTVLMSAIPAKVAGVSTLFMATPPRRGGVSPAVLVAADLAGVDQIYQMGGAHAIAAMAYGTESIPKVDKIVGPGNQYVATAKRLVYGVVDVDMVAGPSEILILSDGKTPARFIASDLISQAEHDERALAILITTSENQGREVESEIEKQLSLLERKAIARESLKQRGAILVVHELSKAIEIANRMAPEHLELCIQNPSKYLKAIKHAGALFLGSYTPEAIGDYMAGPNHILPTGGTARFSSPLSVEDFIRWMNLMRFDQKALGRFEKDLGRFTALEGLEGHFKAIQMRLEG